MAQRKIKLNAIRKKLAEIQALLDESDATAQGETPDTDATDAPPEFPGKPAAMDSAPSLDTRTGRKGLTHVPNTAATRALHNMPGYNRLTK